MNNYFGYIRVSTAKQGIHGVSLQEQRDAIERCAQRHGFSIGGWFEERETAAKQGRPVFTQMLKGLKKSQAQGVIIHKIDRSARNLRDWTDLNDLIDQGVEIIFANEQLDLSTRGGRLCADIQAVVAADYVRNLREEAKKGLYGRLKQGYFPFLAPLGYRNMGPGQAKQLDELIAPLIRRAFELYATGRYNLFSLGDALYDLGLRSRNGKRLSRASLSKMLNNPFYAGVIRLRTSGETYLGKHEALIDRRTFEHVQAVLRGKTNLRTQTHEFLFRRLFRCQSCGHRLIGELQKGRVYYRCHTKGCPRTCVREDAIEGHIESQLSKIQFSEAEQRYLVGILDELAGDMHKASEAMKQSRQLRLGQIESQLNRLTDAFLDGSIEKELFDARKKTLLLERRDLEDRARKDSEEADLPANLRNFLELAKSARLTYQAGNDDEKRELIEIVSSNRTALGKNVSMTLKEPFNRVASRPARNNGGPLRDNLRTLIAQLHDYFVRVPDVVVYLDKWHEKWHNAPPPN